MPGHNGSLDSAVPAACVCMPAKVCNQLSCFALHAVIQCIACATSPSVGPSVLPMSLPKQVMSIPRGTTGQIACISTGITCRRLVNSTVPGATEYVSQY